MRITIEDWLLRKGATCGATALTNAVLGPTAVVLVEQDCGCAERRRYRALTGAAFGALNSHRLPDPTDAEDLGGILIRNCPRHTLDPDAPDA